MKKLVCLLTSICVNNMLLSAQSLTVEYLVAENTTAVVTSTEIRYLLVIKGNESIYFNTTVGKDQFRQGANRELIKTENQTLVKFDDNLHGAVKMICFIRIMLKIR